MEVQAVTNDVRMSPQKVREVALRIQGKDVQDAQALLALVPRKAARLLAKTLNSAVANAEHISEEWTPEEIQDRVGKLEERLETSKKKNHRQAALRKIAQYRGFLESPGKLDTSLLRIKEAVVGSAATLKRWRPRARGSASPILKRSCNIRIVLTDEI